MDSCCLKRGQEAGTLVTRGSERHEFLKSQEKAGGEGRGLLETGEEARDMNS